MEKTKASRANLDLLKIILNLGRINGLFTANINLWSGLLNTRFSGILLQDEKEENIINIFRYSI